MADTPADRAVFHPNVFLGIETDGTVYIVAHRSEMGNGSRTALPRALADELDADWNRVKIVQAVGDARYGSQDTDASRSIHEFFDMMREAGATARLMVICAAAGQWAVPASECSSVLHAVVHAPTHRQSAYGELVLAASRLPVPKKEDVQLKPRTEWRYIGKDASLYDLEDICTGRAIYGMDARLEGMVYASVEQSAGSRRESEVLPRSGDLASAGRAANVSHRTLQASAWLSAARWCGGDRRQHLGGISRAQETAYGLGSRAECRLQLRSIQEGTPGDGAPPGQGHAQ
jgi:hypothetical protein